MYLQAGLSSSPLPSANFLAPSHGGSAPAAHTHQAGLRGAPSAQARALSVSLPKHLQAEKIPQRKGAFQNRKIIKKYADSVAHPPTPLALPPKSSLAQAVPKSSATLPPSTRPNSSSTSVRHAQDDEKIAEIVVGASLGGIAACSVFLCYKLVRCLYRRNPERLDEAASGV
jgi:hypothetical protein